MRILSHSFYKCVVAWSIVIAVLLLAPASATAGRLGEARNAASGHDTGRIDEHGSGQYCDDEDDDEDDLAEAVVGAVAGAFIKGLVEPAIEDTVHSIAQASHDAPLLDDEERHYFEEYPYHHGAAGSMAYPDWSAPPKETSTHFGVEFSTDFNDIARFAAGLLTEWSESEFAFDAQWNYYVESVPGAGDDDLHLGDVNVLWRFFTTERLQIRAGGGLNWMANESGDLGWNTTLNCTYFPVRPLVFRGELDYGRVGVAETTHVSLTAGLMWDRCEIFTGYDFRKIEHIRLQGMITGVRLWW